MTTNKKSTTKTVKKTDKSVKPNSKVVDKPIKEPVVNNSAELKTTGNFYSLDRIIKENADYNIIVGERGNGKTYAIQEYLIKEFLTNKSQCFLLRRWVEDVKPTNAQNFWDGNLTSKLSDMTNGQFSNIIYRNGKYILVSYDDKGKPIIDDLNTIGYVWDVNEAERLKGQSFPFVKNIVYEEFISLSKEGYIPNEITLFLNVLSTIIRDRTNVKIWMLGNTVNPYNPYFDHFGIKGLELKQGDIWTKSDNVTGCKVAVEFCEKRRSGSLFGTSAKYFAFGNKDGSVDMIISGKWQIPDYPTRKFKQKDSKYSYVIKFDDKTMYCHLMITDKERYLFVQMLKGNPSISKSQIVLDLIPNGKPNYHTSFNNLPQNDLTMLVYDLLNDDKVWFDDKMTGSYFYNFMAQSNMMNRQRK